MCFGSHDSEQQAPRPVGAIGAPKNVTIHIPRNRTDYHGVLIPKTTEEIHRADMVGALALMAQYVQGMGAQVTAITVGGAVNTILLQTRTTTHDVDVFGSNLNTQSRALLDGAMNYAQKRSPVNLGTDWFNTETQMWMSPSMQEELTRLAFERQIVVFSRPGLTLLAAPWEYALTAKLSRVLTRVQARQYDLDDAVEYLQQIIIRLKKPIPKAPIMEWARRYNHQVNEEVLTKLNLLYKRRFGQAGVIL